MPCIGTLPSDRSFLAKHASSQCQIRELLQANSLAQSQCTLCSCWRQGPSAAWKCRKLWTRNVGRLMLDAWALEVGLLALLPTQNIIAHCLATPASLQASNMRGSLLEWFQEGRRTASPCRPRKIGGPRQQLRRGGPHRPGLRGPSTVPLLRSYLAADRHDRRQSGDGCLFFRAPKWETQ